MIYNDGYTLDESNKVIIYPQCDNEEINLGEYCKICGIFLRNICANKECKAPAEGNARFCVHCGYYTTFGNSRLLKSWKDAREELELINNFNSETENNNDPDLPF